MKNLAYIISNINKAVAFEWLAESAISREYRIHFILLNPGASHLQDFCETRNIACKTVVYKGKKSMVSSVFAIRKLLKQWKIEIIHCHLFDAGIAGMTAGYLARIKKRIYTRHHSDLHHVSFPHAVKYDKYTNRLSTKIIAVSKMVQKILTEKENVAPSKTTVVHHGFKFDAMDNVSATDVSMLKNKYGIDNKKPVIGVISRYVDWKGIQYIVPAFAQLLQAYPQAHLVLANANGPYKTEVGQLLAALPAGSYTEISFEANIFALYRCFDVFVHCPVSETAEAFGQIYIESLALGIPSVFTRSGIAPEIAKDGENCLVVPFKNDEQVYLKLLDIVSKNVLPAHQLEQHSFSIRNKFSFDQMVAQLLDVYAA